MIDISIIIPVYNCKAFLGDCLRSILAAEPDGSTRHIREIILVDDGSTDGSGVLCDRLAAEQPGGGSEIRVIHQKNRGVSAARNRGMEEASCEYVLFVDADDIMEPDSMQRVTEEIEAERPDLLIFGESFDYYFRGRMYRREQVCFPHKAVYVPKQWSSVFEELFDSNALSPVWNKVIRRSLLTENGIGFEDSVFEMEDFLFSVRCLTYCEKLCTLPDVIYHYRQTEDERNTYNRLCRVESLTAYMRPFEKAVDLLSGSLPGRGGSLENGGRVIGKIYSMFLNEMLRFGSRIQVEKAAEDLLQGNYASVIRAQDPALFKNLSKKKYEKIRRKSLCYRLRHFAAVRYKYLRSF